MTCSIDLTLLYTCRFGFSSAIDTYSPFAFVCNGDETDLEACPRLDRIPGPPCYADEAASAIAIVCGGLVSTHLSMPKKLPHNTVLH